MDTELINRISNVVDDIWKNGPNKAYARSAIKRLIENTFSEGDVIDDKDIVIREAKFSAQRTIDILSGRVNL